MSEDCQCPLAGWCERHQMRKTELLHGLCVNSPKHRKGWDRLAKRDRPKKSTRKANDVASHQGIVAAMPEESAKLLGTRLADLLAAIGVPSCGGCAKRKEWLNKAHAWVLDRFGRG